VIGAGATVLGPVTIGHNSRIGSGSVVVNNIPPHSTVVGIPGRVVEGEAARREARAHIIDLDHAHLPDPIAKAIGTLADYIQKLEKRLDELNARQGGLEEKTAEESEVLNKVRELLRNTGS
jgi:serine O-acetyltransferase